MSAYFASPCRRTQNKETGALTPLYYHYLHYTNLPPLSLPLYTINPNTRSHAVKFQAVKVYRYRYRSGREGAWREGGKQTNDGEIQVKRREEMEGNKEVDQR